MFAKLDKIKLDNYFNELAHIFKRKTHGYNFELILVGGASILLNYDFRDITNDIDAYYIQSEDIKESIKKVSEKFNISPNWINDDFKTTTSFSDKISEFSVFYKSYANTLTIRTIKDEYLIAMKLASGRIYKNDISDIIGIINSCRNEGKNINYKLIDTAVKNLYGNWNNIKKDVKEILLDILNTKDLNHLYKSTISKENKHKQGLLDFDAKYKNTLNEANINEILKMLNNK
ncbi:MAG: hypothetical protein IJ593_07465 [Lachnospiraceae bacterium]|nr:hypothetical protein [Lachnospiraceae bacterium]